MVVVAGHLQRRAVQMMAPAEDASVGAQGVDRLAHPPNGPGEVEPAHRNH